MTLLPKNPPSEISFTPPAAITVLTDGPVTVNATSTQLVPAQSGRTSVVLVNTGTTVIYLKAGASATTGHLPLNPGSSYSASHTAEINGIVASGTGAVYVSSEGRV